MTTSTAVERPKVASRAEWLVARKELLAKEKELTHARDELNRQRLALPWVKLHKTYTFDGPNGKVTLADLFDGRSQLIVQHFMLGSGWKEGCVGCSFLADHVGGALVHLENHDVSYVAVSRAPYAEIEAFHKRMGWPFRWVSSNESDFNFDYHVSFTPEEVAKGEAVYNFGVQPIPIEELPGMSCFSKDEDGTVYHTYSEYARGGEAHLGTYSFLDIAPKGRNETGPRHDLSDWVRHHDRYQSSGHVEPTGRYVSDEHDCGCGESHS